MFPLTLGQDKQIEQMFQAALVPSPLGNLSGLNNRMNQQEPQKK